MFGSYLDFVLLNYTSLKKLNLFDSVIEEWTPFYEQVNSSLESLLLEDMVFLDENPLVGLSTRLPNLKAMVLQDSFRIINTLMTIDMIDTAFDMLKLIETKKSAGAFFVSKSVFAPKVNIKITVRGADGNQLDRYTIWYNDVLSYKDNQGAITNESQFASECSTGTSKNIQIIYKSTRPLTPSGLDIESPLNFEAVA